MGCSLVNDHGREAVLQRQTCVMRPRFFRHLSFAQLPSIGRAVTFVLLTALFVALPPCHGLAQQRTLCVHGLEAPAGLNVRSGPGPDARVIARFPAKACGVRLAGRCEGEWCVMALGQTSGWVNTKHIGVYEVPRGRIAAGATIPGKEQPGASPPIQKVEETVAPPVDAAPRAPARVAAGTVLAERPAPLDRPQRRAPARQRAVVEQGSTDSADDGACVRRVDSDDTLRIRKGPGVDHDEIGDIPPKACGVAVSDACDGRWCRISWRGRRGWANTYYLD